MAARRSKPLLIAPLIPAWAILGIFASESLHGTRYFVPFLALWSVLLVVLFGYILRQAIVARRNKANPWRVR